MTYPVGIYTYVENQERKREGVIQNLVWRAPLGGWEGITTRRAPGRGGGGGARTMPEMMTSLSDAHTLGLA